MREANLVLADGTTFAGQAIGAEGDTVGEAVFTTGMTGYQEVLTDPSYCGQIVTMTAPMMGNTGVNEEDDEAGRAALAGFVVHELSRTRSSWLATSVLDEYLRARGIVGIQGLDTRALTRVIRDRGAQMAAVGTSPIDVLREQARSAPPMTGQDLTGAVTCEAPYEWTEGTGVWALQDRPATDHHVVAVDFGAKHNILRCLVDAGCRVTVVPNRTTAAEVRALKPDGVFLSNGPGDPAPVAYGIELAKSLLGEIPIFGICLGHQILSLALGASTYKLKFGHRGINQPVKNLDTGRVEITTQNHGFAVDPKSLTDGVRVTHVHLNDDTCMGVAADDKRAFSVQFHPEAAAGPHDSRYLFARFADAMRA